MDDSIDIDIEHMLDWLGVKNIEQRGPEYWFSCPFPGHKHGDKKQSASFKKRRADGWGWDFNCLGCGEHGDVVSFLIKHEQVEGWGDPRRKAKKWLLEQYGTGWHDPGDGIVAQVEEILAGGNEFARRELVPIPEEHLEDLSVDWEGVWGAGEDAGEALTYMFRRGFTWQTLVEWEIGYDPISRTLSIPYRDAEGRLIGFKGRAWWEGAIPKYRFLGNKEGRERRYQFETAPVSQLLFGSWKVPPGRRLIVCEGELNTMAMSQFGYRRVTGISGQFLSDDQARQVIALTDEVVLLFDEEEKALAAAEKIEPVLPVWIVPERDCDPADASEQLVAEWLDGALLPIQLLDY